MKSREKVLCIFPGVFDKGGISRYGRFQINAIRESLGKDRVSVTSLMGRQAGDFETPFDVDFSGAMPLSMASRMLFAYEILRMAKRDIPDIVLTGHVNLGPLGLFISRAVGARHIQNVYGRELWVDGGMSWVRRKALRSAETVISDCHNTADRAMEMNLVKKSPKVVWDCVEIQRFKRRSTNWGKLEKYGVKKNNKFRILFLGRVRKDTRYKGFERLLAVLEGLGTNEFEAIIAGKCEDKENIDGISKNLDIEDGVRITGQIEEDDLPDLYLAADAFYLVSDVGPSKGEGIPLTPMEAMSCGVPVLVGNRDGSRELIEDEGGWCGKPEDVGGQTEYIRKLGESREFWEKESKAARRRVEKEFDYEKFREKMINAIG